ncbi:DUF1569 domain-containing protein [Leptobacterium flavescens]|uniref:DUF1569 domain-containing protein n=1 Tax=Leptobacterium flavescens TaxID=472055 RepID=A0A6P0UP83_9FLAO|nr:DUF1569 domain-containing protein [Leptobacterium flavescens]NER15144.1 DUF1569 domain-containing protein [Leptobacterium flavescens]
MKSIFEESSYQELQNRLEQLDEKTQPTWGKMNAAQMCAHCQGPLNVGLEKIALRNRPGLLKRLLFRAVRSSLYNDRPWKQSLPTARQFVINDDRDFHKEKDMLSALITEFHQAKNKENWIVHPYFGKFTPEQWGKMQYKHMDHHLRQFGL